MTRALIPALTLLLLSSLPALAGEWLIGERGDAWTYTGRVSPAQITTRVAHFQPQRSARITAAVGGWRQWSEFADLGRLWVHGERGGRIYVWDGISPQLLADLDEAPGYQSLKVVRTPSGAQVEAWVRPREETIRTPAGTFACRVLQLRSDANSRNWGYRLYLARGAGLVRYVEELNAYDYGLYYQRAEVIHDREPARPGFTTLAIPGALNGVRIGERALVAAGDRLELVDLERGRVVRTFRVPAEHVSVAGHEALITGQDPTSFRQVSHRLDLERLSLSRVATIRGRGIAVSTGGGWLGTRRHFVDVEGMSLRLLDTDGRQREELQNLGLFGYGNYGHDVQGSLLVLPMAYPGGIGFFDLRAGHFSRVNVRDWLHDVKVLGNTIFVAGDFDGLASLPWQLESAQEVATTPVISGAVGRLHVDGDRLYAVTEKGLAIVTAQGRVEKTVPLPNLQATGFALSQNSILDVQEGRAIFLAGGEGLRVVDLR